MKYSQEQQAQRRRAPKEDYQLGAKLNRRDRRRHEKQEQNRLDIQKVERQLKKLIIEHEDLQQEPKLPIQQKKFKGSYEENKGQSEIQNEGHRRRNRQQKQRKPREERERRERRQQEQIIPEDEKERKRMNREEIERAKQEKRQMKRQQRQAKKQERLEQKNKEKERDVIEQEGFVILNQQSQRHKGRREKKDKNQHYKRQDKPQIIDKKASQLEVDKSNRWEKRQRRNKNPFESFQQPEENIREERKPRRQKKFQQKNPKPQQAEQKKQEIIQKKQEVIQKSESKKQIDKENPPDYFLCPITQMLMISPVILATCGHTFEESVIRDWLNKQMQCPLCKRQANMNLIIKNFALAEAINNFK